MWKTIDLTGQRFGRLVTISFAGLDHKNRALWTCLCDCGKTTTTQSYCLRTGQTKSCGCMQHRKGINSTHGMSKTATYRIWKGILARCENPKVKAFPNYGGRGIIVCKRWHKFENFLADMGERPESFSIDRFPDNSGNYEPENCRWATHLEQRHNRRPTKSFVPWNKGKTWKKTKKVQFSEQIKERMRDRMRDLWLNPEFREKMMKYHRSRSKSSHYLPTSLP